MPAPWLTIQVGNFIKLGKKKETEIRLSQAGFLLLISRNVKKLQSLFRTLIIETWTEGRGFLLLIGELYAMRMTGQKNHIFSLQNPSMC
jgi:hypothetical protein